MKLHKYSLEQLNAAIKTSTSMRQTLIKVNVAPYGGNYDVLRKAIKHFNFDTSHFVGQAWNKGKTLSAKVSIEQYLSNEKPIQSYKLKNRLLKEEIFEVAWKIWNKSQGEVSKGLKNRQQAEWNIYSKNIYKKW